MPPTTTTETPGRRPRRSISRSSEAERSDTLLMTACTPQAQFNRFTSFLQLLHRSLWDGVAMWIQLRVAECRCDSILEVFGNEMFQPLSFFVDFIPGILKYVVKKQLQKPVVPHQFPGPRFPALLIERHDDVRKPLAAAFDRQASGACLSPRRPHARRSARALLVTCRSSVPPNSRIAFR